MNYQKIYNQLITRARSENRKKLKKTDTNYVYYENHHIVPEFFFINRIRKGKSGWLDGDPNDPSNLILFTPEEHYTAHLLLVKIYPNISGITYAAKLMSGKGGNKSYGWLRRKISATGFSTEHRNNMSKAQLSRQRETLEEVDARWKKSWTDWRKAKEDAIITALIYATTAKTYKKISNNLDDLIKIS